MLPYRLYVVTHIIVFLKTIAMIDAQSHRIRFRFVNFAVHINAPDKLREHVVTIFAEHPADNSLSNQSLGFFQRYHPEEVTERLGRSRIRPFKAVIGGGALVVAAAYILDAVGKLGSRSSSPSSPTGAIRRFGLLPGRFMSRKPRHDVRNAGNSALNSNSATPQIGVWC